MYRKILDKIKIFPDEKFNIKLGIANKNNEVIKDRYLSPEEYGYLFYLVINLMFEKTKETGVEISETNYEKTITKKIYVKNIGGELYISRKENE